MRTLKVLSLLLSYPQAEALAALDEMIVAVTEEKLLPPDQTSALVDLMNAWRNSKLMHLQENYVALFDRGRSLSLHIFEHVHGESRDRGQAMVDLLSLYESHGFSIATRELPDYIPLFLEYLSQQSSSAAISLLQDAMPVLSLLGARLAERNSPYQLIFDALGVIAGEPVNVEQIRQQVAAEAADETLMHMDKIWEEEAVSFMSSPSPARLASGECPHPNPSPAGRGAFTTTPQGAGKPSCCDSIINITKPPRLTEHHS